MPTNIAVAFVSGILSFLSPCVLALAPGYIVMLTAMTGEKNALGGTERSNSIIGALLYTVGFSTVFITFGAAASSLGQIFRYNRHEFALITGIIVVILGLQASGLLQLGLLSRTSSPLKGVKRGGYLGCFVTGVAFAFGWSPCVGPILGTIMTVAGNQETMVRGILLLVAYSLGLSLPFIFLALGLEKAKSVTRRLLGYSPIIEKVTGLLMVILGLILIADGFHAFSSFMLRLTGSWTPDLLLQPIQR